MTIESSCGLSVSTRQVCLLEVTEECYQEVERDIQLGNKYTYYFQDIVVRTEEQTHFLDKFLLLFNGVV